MKKFAFGFLFISVFLITGCENKSQLSQPPSTSIQEAKAILEESGEALKPAVTEAVQEVVTETEKQVSSAVEAVAEKITASVPKTEGDVSAGFKPFIVYADKGTPQNHFIPSGFMPDGQCIKLNDSFRENCHEGNTCIRIELDVPCALENQRWGGMYWQNPANNWGNRKGGFNLQGATKLTFWAKGEKGGEQIEEFKMGGVTGDYPDTDTALLEKVLLTNEWKQYTIDLRGKDLSYISGGFAWSTNTDVNPESCVFYLDNIQYE